jgi:lysyl-tRNA synthetase class 2
VNADWQPTASRQALERRAAMIEAARGFFRARGLLEVETPVVVGAGVTDVNLQSAGATLDRQPMFLHTSPEYAMKRLLAAGYGDIWQCCRVVRASERSALHNPEFTMLEWYRVGCSMQGMIDETLDALDALIAALGLPARPRRQLRYRDALRAGLGVDPLEAPRSALEAHAVDAGLSTADAASLSRDGLLDLLVGSRIGPALGHGEWLALTHYPASQAALARLDPADPACALRFEVYADGVELANGFEELADAAEQAARFAADNAERAHRGLPEIASDARLLAALEHGLPPCSGVALGFDRAVMIATGAHRIDEVVAFPTERA